MAMIKSWRAWVLLVLLVGPVLAYIGFGSLWLLERGWLLIAGSLWIASGILFSVLAARWTKSREPILPPLDWDAPQTFSPRDRKAWALVEEAAEQAESVSMEALSEVDLYINTGRSLARQLAEHYHPLSHDPIEHVPVVELLSALELAAEDLNRLCRQVPGGDLVTSSHLKTAVQAANYLQKASDLYSFLLPIFSPVPGLVRLGTQQWMVKPAWRNMQQNLLRWFFRAYVNRLGTHLIELYSGRLVIGAEKYRRLTRRSPRASQAVDAEMEPLEVAVAGLRQSGKTSLISALDAARSGDLTLLKARLKSAGLDEDLIEKLRAARLVEVPAYTSNPSSENARDRSTRREAVEQAVEADLLVLVIDVRRESHGADLAFAQAWDRWFIEHPGLESPPAMVVLTGVDRPELGGDLGPSFNWSKGQNPREATVRARFDALRSSLPPTFSEYAAVGLSSTSPFGILEGVLPSLASLLLRAERSALIRHLHEASARSKARRLVSQVGQQGRSLWKHLRSGRKAPTNNVQEPPRSRS